MNTAIEDLDFVLETIDPWLSKYINNGVDELTLLESLGVGVWLIDAEVNNGGFHQYYLNTRGVLAIRTVDAFREVGAFESASLLDAANKEVPSLPLPVDRHACIAALESDASQPRFAALETQYYQGSEDLIGLLAAHLRRLETSLVPNGPTQAPNCPDV
jgi:hypothetical protein